MPSLLDERTQFFDSATDELLVNGSVYIGVSGLDPEVLANQITIYSDRALNTEIPNPQTTDSNGQTTNKVWVPGKYSIAVTNSASVVKYSELDNGSDQTDAQWLTRADSAAFATTTTFTVAGNLTAVYDVGRRVRVSDASTLYGTITASAFTTLTTVTVDLDSGVLSSSLTAVDIGILSGQNQSVPVLPNINETITGRATIATVVIGNTELLKGTISITIPTAWNTYRVDIYMTMSLDKTGTLTATRRIETRMRDGSGTAGTLRGYSDTEVVNAAPTKPNIALYGYGTGLTGTGSQTWSLTTEMGSEGAEVTMKATKWRVKATRVS